MGPASRIVAMLLDADSDVRSAAMGVLARDDLPIHGVPPGYTERLADAIQQEWGYGSDGLIRVSILVRCEHGAAAFEQVVRASLAQTERSYHSTEQILRALRIVHSLVAEKDEPVFHFAQVTLDRPQVAVTALGVTVLYQRLC